MFNPGTYANIGLGRANLLSQQPPQYYVAACEAVEELYSQVDELTEELETCRTRELRDWLIWEISRLNQCLDDAEEKKRVAWLQWQAEVAEEISRRANGKSHSFTVTQNQTNEAYLEAK